MVMRPYTQTVYPVSTISQEFPLALATAPTPWDTKYPGIGLGGGQWPRTEQALYDIPLTSAKVRESPATSRLSCAQQDQLACDNLLSRIQVALATPCGKDLSLHNFSATVELRHVLLFILRSAFLNNRSHQALLNAFPWHANSMESLLGTERWVLLHFALVFCLTLQLLT
jgi:hypothetical protein